MTDFSLCGRGTKIRTQKNGFGDRYVTITSYPYAVNRVILSPNRPYVKPFFEKPAVSAGGTRENGLQTILRIRSGGLSSSSALPGRGECAFPGRRRAHSPRSYNMRGSAPRIPAPPFFALFHPFFRLCGLKAARFLAGFGCVSGN